MTLFPSSPNITELTKLAKLIRYYILISTTAAGSGHPSSSLSAVELMTTLFFGGFFRFDLNDPRNPTNDRVVFSKGHAAPLLYALYAAAGAVDEEELKTLRKFNSRLEGHPTMEFPYTEAATGSLGQGLSIGLGMALNAKIDKLSYRTFVLLGDSEISEGSNWEAIQLATYYKLDNLTGILDINRLGQRGETMFSHNLSEYQKRISAFGWDTILIDDGHSIEKIIDAFNQAIQLSDVHTGKPIMIIAKTIKGKGVSFLENKEGWHGKTLSADELRLALDELGEVDTEVLGQIRNPKSNYPITNYSISNSKYPNILISQYQKSQKVATRKAYGNALVNIFSHLPNLVVLDAETSNSTFAEIFKKTYPDRFFEMFIAEQNMVGVAIGLSRLNKIPFVSTFAAFLTRAFDQIRMSQYSQSNIKFVGSHAGVSIGEDGASQMGLEDIAMFRTLKDCVVLYPSDAVATEKLVFSTAKYYGNVYIRTTRADTPILYEPEDEFPIGGSKVIKQSENDIVTVIAAGITLHQALDAYNDLQQEGINIRVIDLYSIKPIDSDTLRKAAKETKFIITVEDHAPEGGIGEAVKSALTESADIIVLIYSLAVRRLPHSGKPQELLEYEEISKGAIIRKVRELKLS